MQEEREIQFADFRIKDINQSNILIDDKWEGYKAAIIMRLHRYWYKDETTPFHRIRHKLVRLIDGLVVLYRVSHDEPKILVYGIDLGIKCVHTGQPIVIYEQWDLAINLDEFKIQFDQSQFVSTYDVLAHHLTVSMPQSSTVATRIGISVASRCAPLDDLDYYQFINWASIQFGIVFSDYSIPELDFTQSDKNRIKRFAVRHYYALGRVLGWLVLDVQRMAIVDLRYPKHNKILAGLMVMYARKRANVDTLEGIPPEIVPFTKDINRFKPTDMIIEAPEVYDLSISMQLTYRPLLAGPRHETPCKIEIYPSRGYSISEAHAVNVAPGEMYDMMRFNTSMQFTVTREVIPAHVKLNFDVYANRINDCGQVCQNQAGYANIRLAELIQGTKVLKLKVHNTEQGRAEKGTLEVAITSINQSVEDREDTKSQYMHLHKLYQQVIREYINSNVAFYQSLPPLSPSIQSVTVFAYQTRTGVIPGSLFDAPILASSNEDYYLNLLAIAYKRRWIARDPSVNFSSSSTEDLLEEWMKEPKKFKILTIMDMLALFNNYCTYETDEIDHNVNGHRYNPNKVELIESFDDVRPRCNGDCEDFSLESLRHVMELKYNRYQFTSPAILRYVIPIMNEFIFISGLAGVTSAAIAGGSDKTAHLNGHECAYAIPNYIFFDALKRSVSPNCPILHAYQYEELLAGASEKEIIYIIEGTGNLFPEPRDKERGWEALEDRIQDCKLGPTAVENYINAYFYQYGKHNSFYKMLITAITPEFYFKFGYPVFEFLLCEYNPHTKKNNRGVLFTELQNLGVNKHIFMAPCPPIPADVIAASLAIHSHDYPPSSLVLPQITDEMNAVAKQLTRGYPTPQRSPLYQQTPFSFQIRFQEMNQQRIYALNQVLDDLNRALPVGKKFSMRCDVEVIHKGQLEFILGGYSISIY
jgi:hypothetical protein